MTKRIGYARVSSTDQDNGLQLARLKAAGCDIIREEKVSGTSLNGRHELKVVMDFLRAGDTLVVTRIDRLARDIGDLMGIVKTLEEKGAHLQATDQPIDTASAAGKAFLQMLGVFAEFETAIRKERQMAGIAKAKAAGVYAGVGRPRSIDPKAVAALRAEGLGVTAIARRLGTTRSSVYRGLREVGGVTQGK